MIEVTIPRQLKGLLRLGTCSWKYDRGSAPLSIGRFLEALSRRGEPPKSSEGSSS